MGLDTTHDCWHGPYSSFGRWRAAVAAAAGIATYEGRLGLSYWHESFNELRDAQGGLYGDWVTPPEDPLMVLLCHSDCEGRIPHELAAGLADRLEGLLPGIVEDRSWPTGYMRQHTLDFIAGLRAAATKGEDVEFH